MPVCAAISVTVPIRTEASRWQCSSILGRERTTIVGLEIVALDHNCRSDPRQNFGVPICRYGEIDAAKIVAEIITDWRCYQGFPLIHWCRDTRLRGHVCDGSDPNRGIKMAVKLDL